MAQFQDKGYKTVKNAAGFMGGTDPGDACFNYSTIYLGKGVHKIVSWSHIISLSATFYQVAVSHCLFYWSLVVSGSETQKSTHPTFHLTRFVLRRNYESVYFPFFWFIEFLNFRNYVTTAL